MSFSTLTTSAKPQPQLALFVTLRVAPHNAEALATAHRPVWAACAAEPECLVFDVWQDPEDRGRFKFFEVWSKDREWFESEQMTKPYYAALWERSKPLWIEDIKIEYMESFGEGRILRREYIEGGTMMD